MGLLVGIVLVLPVSDERETQEGGERWGGNWLVEQTDHTPRSSGGLAASKMRTHDIPETYSRNIKDHRVNITSHM